MAMASSVSWGESPSQRRELLQGTDFRRHEIVQIGRHDAQKANTRGRRRALVLGQCQESRVEADQRELGIEELLGRRARRIHQIRCQHRDPHLAQGDATRARDIRRCRILLINAECRTRPFWNEGRARCYRERRQRRGVAQQR
jgi:hypothetical protein